MTDKQIIIDGEKENCKILFDCYHIDDSEAYRMIRNGVKITPENAPFDDFELRLISNENSVYGFTSLCKRNKNNDEWEYMGFGHSGAASVVTALLKELSRKEQECEELKRENELAKQLINWILKFFELTDYDWKYDQNEISFLIEDCMDDKQSTIDFVNDINQGLFKTITEIKEIAECCMKQDICTTCNNSDKCHIEDEEIPTYDVCKLILQKISECEVNQ